MNYDDDHRHHLLFGVPQWHTQMSIEDDITKNGIIKEINYIKLVDEPAQWIFYERLSEDVISRCSNHDDIVQCLNDTLLVLEESFPDSMVMIACRILPKYWLLFI